MSIVELGKVCGRALAVWLLFGTLLLACARQDLVARAFAVDFQCPDSVSVTLVGQDRYEASACGKAATYDCVGATCQVAADEEPRTYDPGTEKGGTEKGDTEKIAVEDREPALVQDIHIENKGGQAVLMLDLVLDRSSYLRLAAIPDKRSDLVQLKLVRRDNKDQADKCSFDWMVNNQRIKTPKPVTARDGLLLSQRIHIGPALMDELASAEQVAFRSCDRRYALLGYQVMLVREFIERVHQEAAWKDKPRADGSGGMLAPTGGWPAWQASSGQPTALGGSALDPRELFKKLSASVFQLEATRAHGTAQGSAVAINSGELLTNCHVVQGATKLLLRHEKAEWSARLVRADPKTDRCVISAPEAKLTPIGGTRSYESLEVGEPVYTLGSPVGLELTISDGILSGRREEGGRFFVQTTAPISPGSSGGGLFDARGNLIGITTLVMVGRERLNQALNFAIPADAFWQK